jgi:glucose-1-phosphate thymidylyltransferase
VDPTQTLIPQMSRLRGVIVANRRGRSEVTVRAAGCCAELFPIANRPLIEYGLGAMRECGVNDVVIVASPLNASEIRHAVNERGPEGLSIAVVEEGNCSSTSALLSARRLLEGCPALVYEADGLVMGDLVPLAADFEEHCLDALLLVDRNEAERGRSAPGGEIEDDTSDDPCPPLAGDRLAPVAVIGPAAFDALAETNTTADRPRTLLVAAKWLLDKGADVATRAVEASWTYDGTVRGLLDANRLVLDRITRELRDADLSDARVEGRVQVDANATVARAVVRGPAVLAPGAIVSDSFVGPYTSIGEDARVEGAEVEHSIVLPGACIRNLGARLEGSLVGRDARICRDFAVPATLTVNLGQGGEILLA